MEEHLKSSKLIQDHGIRVDTARLREIVELGAIEVQWVHKTH